MTSKPTVSCPRSVGDMAISGEEFSRMMAHFGGFETAPALACALSGGPDSLALTLLASRWARKRGGDVLALVVNHRPPTLPIDAKRALEVCRAKGVRWRMLSDPDHPPDADQESKRHYRYRLLEKSCADAGLLHLLLGHHRDDQAETFLLRLERGSGVTGLSAMERQRFGERCRLLRPFLGVDKRRLVATCRRFGVEGAADPANHDARARRVAWRGRMGALEGMGLGVGALSDTSSRLREDNEALNREVSRTLAASFSWARGEGRLRLDALAHTPHAVRRRLISRLVGRMGDRPTVSQRHVARVWEVAWGRAPACTVAGVRVEKTDPHMIAFCPVEGWAH